MVLFILSIIGYILAGALALALLLTAVVLFTPISYEFHAVTGKFKFDIRLLWFIKIAKKKIPARKAKKTPSKRGKKKFRVRRVLSFLGKIQDKDEILRHFLTLTLHVLKALKPRKFRANCRVGLENPAHTGLVLALLGILKTITGDGLVFEGNFDEEILEYSVSAKSTFILLPFFWAMLRFALKKPVRQLLRKGETLEPAAKSEF